MKFTFNISRKKLSAIVICLIFVVSSFYAGAQYALAQSGTLTTQTLTGGVVPGAPSYTVFLDNGYYYAKASSGAIISAWTSTDAGAVINSVLANPHIDVKLDPGLFVLSTKINWLQPGIKMQGSGVNVTVLKLANSAGLSVNEGIINIYNLGTIGFSLSDLTLYGNREQNANGAGINVGASFWNTTNDVGDTMILRNLLVENCSNNGIVIAPTGYDYALGVKIESCTSSYNGYSGYSIGSSDGIITNCDAGQNDFNGFYVWGGLWRLSNNKAFGNNRDVGSYYGFYISGNYTQVSTCQADENAGTGWLITCAQSQFTNIAGYRNGFGTAGAAGVFVNNALYNIFSGVFCGNIVGATSYQDYGVFEAGTSDYNIYSNIHTETNHVGQFLLSGANSKLQDSYTGTVWIGHKSGEVHGTSPITVTCAFGGGVTPTSIIVTPVDAYEVFFVTNVLPGSFDITHNNTTHDTYFYWYAEYEP